MLNMSSDERGVTLEEVMASLGALHIKVNELVDDARKVRPLMNKYLGLASKPWMKRPGKKDAA